MKALEPGFVYCIAASNGIRKVGMASNLATRVSQVGVCCPYETYLEASVWCINARKLEKSLHQILKPFHLKGEWFKISHVEFLMALKNAAQKDVLSFEKKAPIDHKKIDFDFLENSHERLKSWLSATKTPMRVIAKKIGVSVRTIELLRSGKHKSAGTSSKVLSGLYPLYSQEVYDGRPL